MARKRYTTEQIIGLLREAEVRLWPGRPWARSAEPSTSCRWRPVIAVSQTSSPQTPRQTPNASISAHRHDQKSADDFTQRGSSAPRDAPFPGSALPLAWTGP